MVRILILPIITPRTIIPLCIILPPDSPHIPHIPPSLILKNLTHLQQLPLFHIDLTLKFNQLLVSHAKLVIKFVFYLG